MTKENVTSKRKKRTIKCPVCGRTICTCREESEVELSCRNCNTDLVVTTDDNRIMICESKVEYSL